MIPLEHDIVLANAMNKKISTIEYVCRREDSTVFTSANKDIICDIGDAGYIGFSDGIFSCTSITEDNDRLFILADLLKVLRTKEIQYHEAFF